MISVTSVANLSLSTRPRAPNSKPNLPYILSPFPSFSSSQLKIFSPLSPEPRTLTPFLSLRDLCDLCGDTLLLYCAPHRGWPRPFGRIDICERSSDNTGMSKRAGRTFESLECVGNVFEPGTRFPYTVHIPRQAMAGGELALYVLLEYASKEISPILEGLIEGQWGQTNYRFLLSQRTEKTWGKLTPREFGATTNVANGQDSLSSRLT